MLKCQRCAHGGLAGEIVEADFGLGHEALGNVQARVFREMGIVSPPVAPGGLALPDRRHQRDFLLRA